MSDSGLETADLKKIPFLSGLDTAEKAALCMAAGVREVSAGEHVFRAGDPGTELYVILDGEVSIELPGGGAQPTHLASLREGTVFGEINFLLASERTADARALRDCRLMVLDNEDLDALEGVGKQAVTSLMATIARVLALRLANMDKELIGFKARLLESFPEAAAIADGLTSKRDALLHEWSF